MLSMIAESIYTNTGQYLEKKQRMEIPQSWRGILSFKSATIVLSILNVVTVLFLLQGFLSSYSVRYKLSSDEPDSVQLRYIKESEEMRHAMQPWELIKRVREIEQETYTESETIQRKDTKQTAAVDLSKRLKDSHSLDDAASSKALEEWRKRKMERARQRELGKNGTASSQA
ncbi:hypothetical protein HS088_TW14G00852 [Tripterygium wilfordii]|uniref:Uncharacterized protein n=1 Tax=Tripterygium wilfordii TaxID=458696 RepID=A0A7J7CRF6_TRIWF|nr:uncharacterized protein LOC120015492 [Tripterygium wilfordii]KAF5736702.1 hypothetical protein HS088_TW14G00852 [Tripterygium wilfordii]